MLTAAVQIIKEQNIDTKNTNMSNKAETGEQFSTCLKSMESKLKSLGESKGTKTEKEPEKSEQEKCAVENALNMAAAASNNLSTGIVSEDALLAISTDFDRPDISVNSCAEETGTPAFFNTVPNAVVISNNEEGKNALGIGELKRNSPSSVTVGDAEVKFQSSGGSEVTKEKRNNAAEAVTEPPVNEEPVPRSAGELRLEWTADKLKETQIKKKSGNFAGKPLETVNEIKSRFQSVKKAGSQEEIPAETKISVPDKQAENTELVGKAINEKSEESIVISAKPETKNDTPLKIYAAEANTQAGINPKSEAAGTQEIDSKVPVSSEKFDSTSKDVLKDNKNAAAELETKEQNNNNIYIINKETNHNIPKETAVSELKIPEKFKGDNENGSGRIDTAEIKENAEAEKNVFSAISMPEIYTGRENKITAAVNGEKIISQVSNAFKMAAKQNNGKFTIELLPKELGKISVEMKYSEGKLNMVINAGNSETAEVLKEHITQLRTSLTANNVEIKNLEVNTGQTADLNFANMNSSGNKFGASDGRTSSGKESYYYNTNAEKDGKGTEVVYRWNQLMNYLV